jgi:virginiamycin B lyase
MNHNNPNQIRQLGIITEYPLGWEAKSTHELALNKEYIFVTGQNNHKVAKLNYAGEVVTYYEMPKGSGPHGILIDTKNQLWVSLEFFGKVVRLNDDGKIVDEVDVNICLESGKVLNPAPHGICLDSDREHIWFTGKRTSTIGKFNIVTKKVEHFELQNLAALPIFLNAGVNETIWGTELQGNAILNVNPSGQVSEHIISTSNSRPIGIIPGPTGKYMWFTEEAGMKIGKIDAKGKITEFSVPALQKNDILASLAFDQENNLWVQVYVNQNDPTPEGNDYVIKFDKSIVETKSLNDVPFLVYYLPSKGSMMHRIKLGKDGNLWFTEMMTDLLGKVTISQHSGD